MSELEVADATKVAVVREFALLQRDAQRVAESYGVSVASVYRWEKCSELVECALKHTSVQVLRAELLAAEAALQWIGREDSLSSVERIGVGKSELLEALRVARVLERQALRFGASPVPAEVAYAFIRDRMNDFPAAMACRAFGVARSGYYAWLRRSSETRFSEDRRLRSAIASVVEEIGVRASYRRISERLRLEGLVCSRHRVKRLTERGERVGSASSSSGFAP
ncbi:hypothetical protein GCM10007164_11090 [Luteimonas padinae]|nr:hypothetical protein GCM10007164_11090 [Luteimonas padinae]